MATLQISLALPGYTASQLQNIEAGSDVPELLDRLRTIASVSYANSGTRTNCTVVAPENGTQATATVTCVTVANNSTVVVGNVTLTGKTAAPSGQAQWLCGVSAAADANSLVNCINSHTTLSTWVSAKNVAGVVTITSLNYDTRANAMALTSSDGTNLAVTTFSGGALDSKSLTVVGI